MARADTNTILPLDEYARIMGINPLHFNSIRLPDVTPEPFTDSDFDNASIWQQFTWQDEGNISREILAQLIHQAEEDIANFLGYSVAPQWVSQEVHNYPRPYRPEHYGYGTNVRSQMKSIKLEKSKLIEVGQRASTLIDTAVSGVEMIFSDPNTDGWDTLVTITVATTLTDTDEIKVYFPDESGDPAWEIRPLKSVTISGANVVITADSWLFLDPDVMNAIPTGEKISINGSTAGNYVGSVEVRREFTDFTEPSAQFYWEREPTNLLPFTSSCSSCSGTGCEACTLITQNGCVVIRDVHGGFVAPIPATYDTDDARWEKTTWTECREPDQVKVWYRAGQQSESSLRGGRNRLKTNLARAIAILTTSRMTMQFRAQTSVTDMVEHWRRVMPESGRSTNTIFMPPALINNPFGITRGEIEVFRMLKMSRDKRMKMGVALG